jgi:hypothetical protein
MDEYENKYMNKIHQPVRNSLMVPQTGSNTLMPNGKDCLMA